MTEISHAAQKVPMMFRAQTAGRCQLQRIARGVDRQDVERWTDEWIDRAHPVSQSSPQSDRTHPVQTKTYTLSWRFVTNSGQDDGIIRPVIGAFGLPYYPGSSMKGAFRRVCTPAQADRYCGKKLPDGDFEAGILRFHGGYPTDDGWQEGLVDIVHPQQDWQVKSDRKNSGAFALISLYKPTLRFGISSTQPETTDWQEVWYLWEQAIERGLGCRVCAGYGQPSELQGKMLYRSTLKGQGAAPKLLDGDGEFRPNVFRASIRGHALRIFGGLCAPRDAEGLVQTLFGGVQGNATVGLLAMNFRDTHLEVREYGDRSYAVPAYQVEGQLNWLLTRELPPQQQEALTGLMKALMRFAMLLGGFGKSWRRVDHRLFYPEYYEGRASKALIGCHWQWTNKSLLNDSRVRKLDRVGSFIDDVREAAKTWMQLQGVAVNAEAYATGWREAWHPEKVQVWGRVAEDDDDCEAVRWFHRPYRQAIRQAGVPEGSIYKTSVTGEVNQVGRLWHRMYPLVRLVKDPKNPKKPLPRPTRQFLELLTFFPNETPESDGFLKFLESGQRGFQRLWGQD